MAETKKFLDYAGLEQLWGKIKSNFISEVSFGTISETNGLSIEVTKNGAKDTLNIPIASSTGAGLMSADQAETVAAFSNGVAAVVPFTGLKINNTATTLTDRVANINLVYNSENKKIQIVDVNNSNAELASISTTDFVKDGMLSSAELVTNPSGQAAGTYIKLTWNTDGGKDPMFINVTQLIDTYTAGNGIQLNDKTFSVKINSDYLSADENGLSITNKLFEDINEKTGTAESNAKDYVDNALKSYSTTAQMEQAISAAANKAKEDAIADTTTKLASYSTTEEMNSAISTAKSEAITHTNNALKSYSTTDQMNSAISSAAGTAKSEAIAHTDNALKSYSTTTQMEQAIGAAKTELTTAIGTAKEDAINHTNTQLANYTNTANMTAAINKAKEDAIADTATKLQSYSTTTQMNSAISTAVGDAKSELTTAIGTAKSEANSYTDTKLAGYAKTADMNTAISDAKSEILGQFVAITKSEIDSICTL